MEGKQVATDGVEACPQVGVHLPFHGVGAVEGRAAFSVEADDRAFHVFSYDNTTTLTTINQRLKPHNAPYSRRRHILRIFLLTTTMLIIDTAINSPKPSSNIGQIVPSERSGINAVSMSI